MVMKFYLVRHADKAEGDYYSQKLRHQDQPLSDLGRWQAHRIKDYLLTQPFKSIFISEYSRTEETARPLAMVLQIAPIVDSRLNEIDNGLIEGLSEEDIRDQYPDVWTAYQDGDRDFQWPEGESGEQAQNRIVGFINEHLDQEGDIVVIAHDGIIRLLICHILGMPVYHRFSFQLDTAGVTEIEWHPERSAWKLIRYNQRV
jgi:broad specificity phosphatase PhoE